MFELGMRLAFDKPTIIVKDDKTSYSFDTAPIEHVPYPRDLRYAQIVEFKDKLTEKIKGTYSKASSDSSYTTFLKNFGEFTVAKLDKKEVSGQEYILEELKGLRESIQRLERQSEPIVSRTPTQTRTLRLHFPKRSEEQKNAIDEFLMESDAVDDFIWLDMANHSELRVEILNAAPAAFDGFLKKRIGELYGRSKK